ncbi:MAG: hypothetical protein Q4D27_03895 [Coriobacteriia bacterium]|nr:hypothetical protein [Coriobacteriia bacterium]
MEERAEKRMRMNLAKGIACLVIGAIVIAAIEVLWDHADAGNRFRGASQETRDEPSSSGGFEFQDMMSSVLTGNLSAIGMQDVPQAFLEECFDAAELGDARCSADGGVIGIVSDAPASELFEACVGKLVDRGWLQVESGYPLRCTFLKESGALHWLFLDVNQVSGDGVAVLVLGEGDES